MTFFEQLKDIILRNYDWNGYVRSIAETRLKHLSAFFALDRVKNITTERLTQYQDARIKEGAGKATINRELAVLYRAFRLAAKQNSLYSRNTRDGSGQVSSREAGTCQDMPQHARVRLLLQRFFAHAQARPQATCGQRTQLVSENRASQVCRGPRRLP